jgi:hypothetical protein
MRRIGVFLFFHEGVGVQPFQQAAGIGRDDLALRKMDMAVDKARNDQMRPMIGVIDTAVPGGQSRPRARPRDLAAGNRDPPSSK